MRISVIGAGYVGLISAVCFADRGYEVTLSTEDPKKVESINHSVAPFHETGLEEILEKVVSSGRLRAVFGREKAVESADVTFIAVGTPSKPDGSIDLTFIKGACVEIGKALKMKRDYHLIAIRSTVVPGTTEKLVKPIIEKRSGRTAGKDFGLVMQPEFLRQGSAIHDTLNPDRIVIGEFDLKSGETLLKLYSEFYGEKLPPTLRMNLPSAEMTKYASNAFLATKISYMNEIANICEKVPGVDVVKIAECMGLDPRIGKEFLHAGAGFGGSCFPKDVKAMTAFARTHHYTPRILESTLKVNRNQSDHVVELVRNRLRSLRGKRIAVLGFSFKPGTDDIREAPSIRIIHQLLKEGAKVVGYDPVAIENAKKILGQRIEYADSSRSCLEGTDAALIVTEWKEFTGLAPTDFKDRMSHPILIDARRIYDPARYGLDTVYSAVGLAK